MTNRLKERMPLPRIGLLPTGHEIYWSQFPGLRDKCMLLRADLRKRLEKIGTVIGPDLVDTPEKAVAAGELFRKEKVDLVFVFPLGYTTGMVMAPAVQGLDVPIRLLNAHPDRSYDYKTADTAEYLYHEGPCCIPEYAGTLAALGRSFKVRTGHFGDPRLWKEITADCVGAAAGRMFRSLNFGVIGNTYTNMTDMPTDEHRVLRATGRLLKRPEVEEVEEAYAAVTADELRAMTRQLRELYDVDPSVTDAHMEQSARIAVAYDKVVVKHDINAFGYYWWGVKESITQLRSQSALAVSRLAALGRPGVTEGDVKTAMALKIMDLLGAGGMFVEFFAMNFDDPHLLVGHDGPANVNMAEGRPRLQHLTVHHGKTGHGLGIDFKVRKGPVTLLNLTQFNAGESFKLIMAVGEVTEGDLLNIGNPNCRIKLPMPLQDFFEGWCQQGPCHHLALGIGDQSLELSAFAETMGFTLAKVT